MRSLRSQLTLGAAALVLLVVAAAGVLLAVRLHVQDLDRVDQDLSARLTKVSADADKLVADRNDRTDTTGAEDGLLVGSRSFVRVLDGDRVVVAHGDLPADPVPFPTSDGYATVDIGGEEWRSLVAPIAGGARVQVLDSLTPVAQRLDDDTRLIAVVTAAAALVAGLVAWLVAGYLVAPLQRLRTGAHAIRSGHDLEQRLPPIHRPQEVAELADTLDEMLVRLRTSMLATRRFTADAGHELRTPLTGLGADLETLHRNPDLPAAQRREIVDAMRAEHARLVRLLDGLQALARGDALALPERVEVDVAEIVVDAVELARRRYPDLAVTATVADAVVIGWPDGLRSAVANLIENAARHGRANGRIDVTVRRRRDAVEILVDDDGPGIPDALREAVKERFRRGPSPTSPGSGLGLAIVDQQAVLHDGALDLARSPSGGLRAVVRLPATAL